MLLSPQHRFYSTYQAFVDDSPILEISASNLDFYQKIDNAEFVVTRSGGCERASLVCDHILTRHIKSGWFYRFRPNPSADSWFVGSVESVNRRNISGSIEIKGLVKRLNATPHETFTIGDSGVLQIVSTIMEESREQPYSLPGPVKTGQFDGDSDVFKFQWRWAISESSLDHLRLLSVFTKSFIWGCAGGVGTALQGLNVSDYDFFAFLGQPDVWRTLDENKNYILDDERENWSNIVNKVTISYEDEDTGKKIKKLIYDKDSADEYGLRSTEDIELWTMTTDEFIALQEALLNKYSTPAVTRSITLHHDDSEGATDNFIENAPPFPWNGRILLRDEGGLVINPGDQSEVWETVISLNGKAMDFQVSLGDPKDDFRYILSTVRNAVATLYTPLGEESGGITRHKTIVPCPAAYRSGLTYDEDALEPPVAWPDPAGYYAWSDVARMMRQTDIVQTTVNLTNPSEPLRYYDSYNRSPTPPIFGPSVSTTESLKFSHIPTNWMKEWFLPMMSLAEMRKNKSGIVNWHPDLCRNRYAWYTENAYKDDGTIDTRRLTGWGIRWPEDDADAYLHAGLQFHLSLFVGVKANLYDPAPYVIYHATGDTDYQKILAAFGSNKIWITKQTRYPYRVETGALSLWDIGSLTAGWSHQDKLGTTIGTYGGTLSFVGRAASPYSSGTNPVTHTTYINNDSLRALVHASTYYMTTKGSELAVSLGRMFAMDYRTYSVNTSFPLDVIPVNNGVHRPDNTSLNEQYRTTPAVTPYPKRLDGIRKLTGGTGKTKFPYQSISNLDVSNFPGSDTNENVKFGRFRKILVCIPLQSLTLDTTKKPITTYEYRVEGYDDYIAQTLPTV